MGVPRCLLQSDTLSPQGKAGHACRMCIRFIPVEVVCHADLADIKKMAKALIDQHFPADKAAASISFAVFYEHRASVKLKRMDVINAIVDEIPQVILKHGRCSITLLRISA